MRLRLGMKHTGSCLPDQIVDVEIDTGARVVTMLMFTFDSALVAALATDTLLNDHGVQVVQVVQDDSLGMVTPPAPYKLVIEIGKHLFNARVVKLMTGAMTVFLEPSL